MTTKKQVNERTYEIIGAAIEIHKELGPGLLEHVYESCMVHELQLRSISVESQVKVPVMYKGVAVRSDLRFDLVVEDLIIVELKSVNYLLPIYEAQLLTYLKLLKKPKGILINFNSTNIFREGQKTYVTEWFDDLK